MGQKTHTPFLLCDCSRGAGVKSSSHKCELIPNDKQLYHWNCALHRLNNKLDKNIAYTEKEHRDWYDEFNKGITNYGVNPDLLPRNLIRFGIFHLKVQLQKKLMEYLQTFIIKQLHETIQEFSKVLL